MAGRVWADRARNPTWTILLETADGTVYAGGSLPAGALEQCLSGVETRSGELVVGFSGPDDPVRRVLPPDPFFTGEAIDFTDRVPPAGEQDVMARPPPEGARLATLDEELLPRTEWYEDTLHAYGSLEAWDQNGIGRCLLVGREVAAEAMAGPRVRRIMEMGVATRGPYRRRGYGTLVSQHVARACEAGGDHVWWNTSADNIPSQAIARRLGFRRERRYDLVAYRTSAFRR
jgi:RimJ/RimL family protein N-acetyltransferase